MSEDIKDRSDPELRYLSVERSNFNDPATQAEWTQKRLVWVPSETQVRHPPIDLMLLQTSLSDLMAGKLLRPNSEPPLLHFFFLSLSSLFWLKITIVTRISMFFYNNFFLSYTNNFVFRVSGCYSPLSWRLRALCVMHVRVCKSTLSLWCQRRVTGDGGENQS